MKKISEHLGQIIIALAGVALLIAACVVFKAPIGDFFNNIVSKETAVGEQLLVGVENPDLSDLSGSGGNGGSTQGCDTLYWDGNTDGLVSVELSGMLYYHVSDNVLTSDNFANGFTCVWGRHVSEGNALGDANVSEVSGLIIQSEALFIVVPSDNFAVDDLGVTFPEAGIYALNDGEDYMASLTIPGFTGFPVNN